MNNTYKYKLSIMPALEADKEFKEFLFNTKEEVIAAMNTTASMLLYLQDELKVMADYSNVFAVEEFIDNEWEEIDLEE